MEKELKSIQVKHESLQKAYNFSQNRLRQMKVSIETYHLKILDEKRLNIGYDKTYIPYYMKWLSGINDHLGQCH